MSRTGKLHSNRRRGLKVFPCIAGMIFLFAFVTSHAVPGLFARFDDPARLGVLIHVTVTNEFTIRWVEKSDATNRVALNLVFIHGTLRNRATFNRVRRNGNLPGSLPA